ncbi:MAG: alpha-amylase [Spirochaetaceae bacterium]|nr:MAG: alpha-amylase [Spirochaetaceae bacterium]
MVSVCFYFQVHQPFRLRKNYSFFDIGADHFYEDETANREICNKVAAKCYIPMNQLLLELIEKHKGKFKVSFSITGVAIEQLQRFSPNVIDLFKQLAQTGCVEFIGETYYHSLAFLFSKEDFKKQVLEHREMVKGLFGQEPVTFRNTELIYNNELGKFIEDMGYQTILAEGADHILGWRSPNFMYQPKDCYKLGLLLKNYKLSDDIAFRFSNKGWSEHPLTAEKYASWLHALSGNGELVNLFMDYETFGEHQWEDTGIFQFMRKLPDEIMKHPDFGFITPREAHEHCTPVARIDVPHFMSWADIERDLTAWLGNPMQNSASEMVYAMEKDVYKTGDKDIISIWHKLLTSDHFYYMCTKWFSDGDVHKYFNPYDTPFDAYIIYVNVLNDLKETVKQRLAAKRSRSRVKKTPV